MVLDGLEDDAEGGGSYEGDGMVSFGEWFSKETCV